VPDCWLDVRRVAHLDELAGGFRTAHGRWFRVATKYVNLARQFFVGHGFNDYRIVESLGATEGTPAAGTADLIVDITTTGATLKANALRILDDGVILKSQANLVASNVAEWTPRIRDAQNEIMSRLGV
jgi:ATP phosphoribosyltransferase